jgi:hypothetical protein
MSTPRTPWGELPSGPPDRDAQPASLPGLPEYPRPPVGTEEGVAPERPHMTTADVRALRRERPARAGIGVRWLIAAAFALLLAWWWQRPAWPDRIRLPEPEQTAVEAEAIELRGATLRPLARFDISGVVVGRERYVLGRESTYAPFDVGLVWGVAAEPDMFRVIRYSQSARFLWWRARSPLPVSEDELNRAMANIHAIPATRQVRRRLAWLGQGDVVRMRGYLVELIGPDGWIWRSSMTRDDTGNGACEVMLVESVEHID